MRFHDGSYRGNEIFYEFGGPYETLSRYNCGSCIRIEKGRLRNFCHVLYIVSMQLYWIEVKHLIIIKSQFTRTTTFVTIICFECLGFFGFFQRGEKKWSMLQNPACLVLSAMWETYKKPQNGEPRLNHTRWTLLCNPSVAASSSCVFRNGRSFCSIAGAIRWNQFF
jgi:hypothetical protein